MANLLSKAFLATAIAAGVLCIGALRAEAADFVQVKLVSDVAGLSPTVTDPALVNPWGVSHSPTSPFWVSNQGTNTATVYAVAGSTPGTTTVAKVTVVYPSTGNVPIPTTKTGPQGPTGQVNNANTKCFPVGNGGDGKSAHFIFADLNGTISAWDALGSPAFIQATTPGAVYTGLAINGAQTRLYAANIKAGTIDVFDCNFSPVKLGPDAFVNPLLRPGLAPFNVQEIRGDVYVTYAPAGPPDNQRLARLGAGAVAVFDEDGNFLTQPISGGRLSSPWGITLAPAGFGRFGNRLLVGNFSYLHSAINAFDPTDGEFRGALHINTGGLPPGGLWAIEFGVGGSNGSPDVLYFADGINHEMDGLLGAIFSRKGPP